MPRMTRLEDTFLAPDDPGWGDERARDEFYRGSTMALNWMIYGAYVIAIVAAAVGNLLTSFLVFLLPTLATMTLCAYCTRRGIDVRAVSRQFAPWRRRLAYATVGPLVAVWLALFLWQTQRDSGGFDVATLAGAVVGAAVGGGAAYAAARIVRRRSAVALDGDDGE
ncbi:hypothetical protein G4X40_06445 [Rhodococcus sp. D2-41]|uniref:Uncharacterized protein n=1 Tax=Speluncibacter jeojiensis TaxID=2710754 RepID=A0A9X4LY69_9ACTN|nr:hypothetical protein [Rhodococcus sp. D2-41]MDG3009784.1 hypothetical protein [Rhodococcus sp. D2-41]MDG3014535.1 hypothetical protein [Corynebacteriales bacterium D3-21]